MLAVLWIRPRSQSRPQRAKASRVFSLSLPPQGLLSPKYFSGETSLGIEVLSREGLGGCKKRDFPVLNRSLIALSDRVVASETSVFIEVVSR